MRKLLWILAIVTVPAVVASGLNYFKPEWIRPGAMGGPVAIYTDADWPAGPIVLIPEEPKPRARIVLGFAVKDNPSGAGTIVRAVSSESSEERAGLRVNDVILSADGQMIDNAQHLFAVLRKKKPGDQVTFEVKRAVGTQRLEITLSGLTKIKYPECEFSEVRAFAWPGKIETEHVMLPDSRLGPGVLNPAGAVLTTAQVQRLLVAINGDHPHYLSAACFFPHNALVFYDRDKQPVGHLELCFDCTEHEGSAQEYVDMAALAAIFFEHRLPVGFHTTLAEYQQHFSERRQDAARLEAKTPVGEK